MGIVIVFSVALANSTLTPAPSHQFSVKHHDMPVFDAPEEASAPPPAYVVTDIEARVINDDSAHLVHAPSVAQLDSGGLIATWWGGSREGGKDVKVFTSFFNPDSLSWDEPIAILSAKNTQTQTLRYIRKLGNVVITQDPEGTLHLFYVSVSFGGWAASAINWSTSLDEGQTWSTSKRLITSPFLNLSTLVKGTPVFYKDGSIGLPVYHEFAGKFGELLRISTKGEVITKTRMSKGKHSLQPVIHVSSPTNALALMRYAGPPDDNGNKRVLQTTTQDAGAHWSKPAFININNPNSAIALAHHNTLGKIGVFNDINTNRYRLKLYTYNQGKQWSPLHSFEDKTSHAQQTKQSDYEKSLQNDVGQYKASTEKKAHMVSRAIENMCENNQCEFQYDYPYLIQDSHNQYHLVYTWNKSAIKHVSFSLTPSTGTKPKNTAKVRNNSPANPTSTLTTENRL
ncbi:hypothetical protein A9Q81_24065 [Gammaproteobacteria bacterium 42_54_T18]|nr:hypothetical protein A9Q81_24065 [Gammaproteobacteria bacterium 42_54_T18]